MYYGSSVCRSTDQEIPVRFQLSHVDAVAEARRTQQLAASIAGAPVGAPGEKQDQAEQQERNVGCNLAIAELPTSRQLIGRRPPMTGPAISGPRPSA